MTQDLKNRVALVTGGGQGVGQGIARALASGGASVVIAQRRGEEAERETAYLRETYGVKTLALTTDVTQVDQVNAMVKATEDHFGRLDILVNNAGGSFPKRLEKHSDEDMAASFDLNYWSAFRAMRAAFPIMKAQQYGRIINLGSLNGVNAHMFTAAYNAGKEAVRALSRTAAVEWGPFGITVNIICPASASPHAEAYMAENPEMFRTLLQQIPVGRMGRAEQDIGPVALFLASEASGFVNGNTFFVDGGSHVNGVAWRPEIED